jgi:hypothetical protein
MRGELEMFFVVFSLKDKVGVKKRVRLELP